MSLVLDQIYQGGFKKNAESNTCVTYVFVKIANISKGYLFQGITFGKNASVA